jgi:hypothetical protein
MTDFSQQIFDQVKDKIPKTPEAAEAGTDGFFSSTSLGNMWDRIYGFNGDVSELTSMVDAKGGDPKVAKKSYLGAIITVLKGIFKYGDVSSKDNDPIYNTKYAQPDIEDINQDDTIKDDVSSSKLYIRIESIFKYFSKKTQYMFEKIELSTEQLGNIDKKNEESSEKIEELSKGLDENSQKMLADIEKLKKDLDASMQENIVAKIRIGDLERDMKKIKDKFQI